MASRLCSLLLLLPLLACDDADSEGENLDFGFNIDASQDLALEDLLSLDSAPVDQLLDAAPLPIPCLLNWAPNPLLDFGDQDLNQREEKRSWLQAPQGAHCRIEQIRLVNSEQGFDFAFEERLHLPVDLESGEDERILELILSFEPQTPGRYETYLIITYRDIYEEGSDAGAQERLSEARLLRLQLNGQSRIPDSDGDRVPDNQDNCPQINNPEQIDTDEDDLGDECDDCPLDIDNDIDQDGTCANQDNCPLVFNQQDQNQDGDEFGDLCDPCDGVSNIDADQDKKCDEIDNCPLHPNPGQVDRDGDGIGDLCDLWPEDPENDTDGDGVPNGRDNCVDQANPGQQNQDGDEQGDLCDLCPLDSENDVDQDTVCGDEDNCPDISNRDQGDEDQDGDGDVCDSCPLDPYNDYDNDNVCGNVDNCPTVYNPGQENEPIDGEEQDDVGDACEVERCDGIDNNGNGLVDEGFPDQDGDELADCMDFCIFDHENDQDGDQICEILDNCPNDPNHDQLDEDNDGQGDECDICPLDPLDDDDNDDVCDNIDNCLGLFNPIHPDLMVQLDSDGDGLGDECDDYPFDPNNDIDRDLCPFNPDYDYEANPNPEFCVQDNCPNVNNPGQFDSDNDGLGDACDACARDPDNDRDRDSHCHNLDNCPFYYNPNQNDLDEDGIGDACDSCRSDPLNDADGDTICDGVDNCVGISNFNQSDIDRDGKGDLCDKCPRDPFNDIDRDDVCREDDNCPAIHNNKQSDNDNDGIGDICDICPNDDTNDRDLDEICGKLDNCPHFGNPDQIDSDGDGIGDICDDCPNDYGNDSDGDSICGDEDNCPGLFNPIPEDQMGDSCNGELCDGIDNNNNGIIDEGYSDVDHDGIVDCLDSCPLDRNNDSDMDSVCGNVDNCPNISNETQRDRDDDHIGDACDECVGDDMNDIDGDGICGDSDNCPSVNNIDQNDVDFDGIGDQCDDETCDGQDNDGDGEIDEGFDDTDGDGDANCADDCPLDEQNDQDGDGHCADVDNCPTVPNPEQMDLNMNGIGDICEGEECNGIDDNDNDIIDEGFPDSDEDGSADCIDDCPQDAHDDEDQDGYCADQDNCPEVRNPDQEDVDEDGIGDLCDIEECDGRDNNGDAEIDEGFPDVDGRGGADCHDHDGDGLTEEEGDCDDEEISIHPGAEELWYDGINSDCNDEEDPSPCDRLPPSYELETQAGCRTDLYFDYKGLCAQECDADLEVILQLVNQGEQIGSGAAQITLYGIDAEGLYHPLMVYPSVVVPDGGHSTAGFSLRLIAPEEGVTLTVLNQYQRLALFLDDSEGRREISECDESNNFIEIFTSALPCPQPEGCEQLSQGEPVEQLESCRSEIEGDFHPVIRWQWGDISESCPLGPACDQDLDCGPYGSCRCDDQDEDGECDCKESADDPNGEPRCLKYSYCELCHAPQQFPSATRVMMSPVVGNLNDDNGDGFIDQDDIPDVAFISYSSAEEYEGEGVLRVISGQNGAPIWSTSGLFASGGVALADLDRDGEPEVLARNTALDLNCYDHEGALLWTCDIHDSVSRFAYPAVADLDMDGDAEVVIGRSICDHLGNLLLNTVMDHAHTAFPLDINLGESCQGDEECLGDFRCLGGYCSDGEMELISGYGVSRLDGETLWTGGNAGHAAAANFDGDPAPEIVSVRHENGQVALYDNDGSVVWSAQIPGGGGGPPSIADFNGDGFPEIGVAGAQNFVVFLGKPVLEPEEQRLLWSRAIEDAASYTTGSSAYDFDGDGEVEVVFASEENLWVANGATGEIIFQEGEHTSATLQEYPVIVDVDRDSHVEILVVSNSYGAENGLWEGITALGDRDHQWIDGRPVWNQYAYHITQIEDDLSVPQFQHPHWLPEPEGSDQRGNNSFRQGSYGEHAPQAASNLRPSFQRHCLETCIDEEEGQGCLEDADCGGDQRCHEEICRNWTHSRFQIENQGLRDLPAGTLWSLYGLDAEGMYAWILSERLESPIWAGWSSKEIEIKLWDWEIEPYRSLLLVVDDDGFGQGQYPECDEFDNSLEISLPCEP